MNKYLRLIFTFAVLSILVSSCKKDIVEEVNELSKAEDYSHKIVHEWNDLYLEIDRYAEGYRPCPTARAMAYINLSAYEACVPGMVNHKSIINNFVNINLPTTFKGQEYHWPSVINASNAYLYKRFFPFIRPDHSSQIDVVFNKNATNFVNEVGDDIYARSKNHGEAVAAAIWEWSKTDIVNHDYYLDPTRDYDWTTKFIKNGDWKPTRINDKNGLFPDFGKGRSFAIGPDLKICRPPLNFSENNNSQLYAQALEVYAQNTPTMSYQAEWVAEFWSDDLLELTFSPPARWLAIANQVYVYEKSNLELALVANTKIGVALNDAAIGCWNSKYHYNIERPETYIRRVIDDKWETNLENPLTGESSITPDFPAYPSGHATFGAAAAEALASVFGYSYSMVDRCHENRNEFIGVPRPFSSFEEMANENGWSRIPLGVHYRMDSEEGVRYGKEIGRKVNNLSWKK
ncbi:MAG: vanadium-dependent haloperoxidase [Saprospiraceae bacterium]|nr:vanadium-dependent haloperoxidase [Saprospiraceae bacterium]